MKLLLILAVVGAIVAVSYGKYCNGTHYDDPSSCGFQCQSGEVNSCERGGICSCTKICAEKADCDRCGTIPDIMNPGPGHVIQEEAYCVNNQCKCYSPHHFSGGDHSGPHVGDPNHP